MASVSALAVLCRSDRLHSGCIGWVTVRIIGRVHLALQHPYSLLKLSLKRSLEKTESEKRRCREEHIWEGTDFISCALPLVCAHVSDLLSLRPKEPPWLCMNLQSKEPVDSATRWGWRKWGRTFHSPWHARQLLAVDLGALATWNPWCLRNTPLTKSKSKMIFSMLTDLMLLQMLQLCFFLAKLAQIVYEFLADSATRSPTQIS